MVGLLLASCCEVEAGDVLADEVVPWAAALSDLLLSSHCAACFGPCSTLRFPCPGPCEGALLYCSSSCRDSDLPLHSRSAECNLVSLLRSSASPVSSSGFPSLGGTCDVRTALRLLAQHYSLNHIAPFLAGSPCAYDVDHRLGGLLSNRLNLLQPSDPGSEEEEKEDEEICLATELREAAMLMCQVCYSTSSVPSVFETRNDDAAATCVAGSTHCSPLNEDVERHIEDVCMAASNHSTRKRITSENRLPHVLECMEGGGNLDFHANEHVNVHGAVEGDVCAGIAVGEHLHTFGSNDRMSSMTQAEKLLLVEEVLCQVFTNGVRVHMDAWTADGNLNVRPTDFGTAVYGPMLSWINHSCRPNAFYSFVLAGQAKSQGYTRKVPLVPDVDVTSLEDTWRLKAAFPWSVRANDEVLHCLQHYSPRARLRSIRNIKGVEPVYMSYTNLLQPKNMRRQELWLKYRFLCTCERCDVKSTEGVDGFLQKLGFYENGSNMLALEEWLSGEAQRGISKFLQNDNPLSCCEVLEDAMLKLLHYACQSYVNAENLHCGPQRESFGYVGQFSARRGRHVKFHLMHHICLNMYMALSSSYRVLATGCDNASHEGPFKVNAVSRCGSGVEVRGRREVECSMASAAYSLVQAAMVQHLCDFDEPGLLAIAARFWLQNWEAFIYLISKLDSYLCLESMSEMQCLLSTCIRELKSIILLPENTFVCKIKVLLNGCRSVQNCHSTSQLLQCSVTTLWPLLRSTSPFLSNVESPFDVNEVCIGTIEKQAGVFESKDDWLCYRGEAFVCALCSLRLGFGLMNILYGSDEKLIAVMEDFLSSCFGKGSTMR